jgi:hypothetical protein
MIEQGRMKGWIDQPEGLIYFEEEGAGVVQRKWSQIVRWDEAIKELCAHVEEVASVLSPAHTLPRLLGVCFLFPWFGGLLSQS